MIEVPEKEKQLEEHPHYLNIYDKEFKILEKPSNELWNTDENHTIAVHPDRFEQGDYVSSDVPVEPIIDEVEEEPREQEVVEGENAEEQPEEVVIEETVEEESLAEHTQDEPEDELKITGLDN